MTIEQKIICGVTGWTLHDLRRTARSLMSRAGSQSDHAERCLGHLVGGVRGTYDRHDYHEEKWRAFEALAALTSVAPRSSRPDYLAEWRERQGVFSREPFSSLRAYVVIALFSHFRAPLTT